LGCVPKGKSEVEGVTAGYMGRENGYWRGLHNMDNVEYTGDQREAGCGRDENEYNISVLRTGNESFRS
jgi:hypothetical protein